MPTDPSQIYTTGVGPGQPNLAPTAGPFTPVLEQAGAMPGQQMEQNQGYTGGSKLGGLALIGDKMLQGFERGRMIGYVRGEAKREQQFQTGMAQLQGKRSEIMADKNIDEPTRQARLSQNQSDIFAYQAARFQSTSAAMGGGEKKGKGKKAQDRPSGSAGGFTGVGGYSDISRGASIGGKSQQQQQPPEDPKVSFGKNMFHTMGNILNTLGGGRLPETANGHNLDWVTARNAEIDKMQSPERTQMDQRKAAFWSEVQPEFEKAADTIEAQGVMVKGDRLDRLQKLYPNDWQDQIRAHAGAKYSPEFALELEDRKATDQFDTGRLGPPPKQPTKKIEYTPGSGTPPYAPGGVEVPADPGDVATYYRDMYDSKGNKLAYTPEIALQQRKMFPGWNQQTVYMVSPDNKLTEVTQVTPMTSGGAKYMHNGHFVDTKAMVDAGFRMTTDRPRADVRTRYNTKENENGYMFNVDPYTGQFKSWVTDDKGNKIRGRATGNKEQDQFFNHWDSLQKTYDRQRDDLDKEEQRYQNALVMNSNPLTTGISAKDRLEGLRNLGLSQADIQVIMNEKDQTKVTGVIDAASRAIKDRMELRRSRAREDYNARLHALEIKAIQDGIGGYARAIVGRADEDQTVGSPVASAAPVKDQSDLYQ